MNTLNIVQSKLEEEKKKLNESKLEQSSIDIIQMCATKNVVSLTRYNFESLDH